MYEATVGRREKYQPIQYCWAGCLGYPVHTCDLHIDIQQIYCSAQTGQPGHCNIYIHAFEIPQCVNRWYQLCNSYSSKGACMQPVHIHVG